MTEEHPMKPGKTFLIVVAVGALLLVAFLAFTGPGKLDVDAVQSPTSAAPVR